MIDLKYILCFLSLMLLWQEFNIVEIFFLSFLGRPFKPKILLVEKIWHLECLTKPNKSLLPVNCSLPVKNLLGVKSLIPSIYAFMHNCIWSDLNFNLLFQSCDGKTAMADPSLAFRRVKHNLVSLESPPGIYIPHLPAQLFMKHLIYREK